MHDPFNYRKTNKQYQEHLTRALSLSLVDTVAYPLRRFSGIDIVAKGTFSSSSNSTLCPSENDRSNTQKENVIDVLKRTGSYAAFVRRSISGGANNMASAMFHWWNALPASCMQQPDAANGLLFACCPGTPGPGFTLSESLISPANSVLFCAGFLRPRRVHECPVHAGGK